MNSESREDQSEIWKVEKEHMKRNFARENILALPQNTSYLRIHIMLTFHKWFNQCPQINKQVSLNKHDSIRSRIVINASSA